MMSGQTAFRVGIEPRGAAVLRTGDGAHPGYGRTDLRRCRRQQEAGGNADCRRYTGSRWQARLSQRNTVDDTGRELEASLPVSFL